MRVAFIIFGISLICILGWVFIWPVMFIDLQYSELLRTGALATLVLFFISIISLVFLRQRRRQTEAE